MSELEEFIESLELSIKSEEGMMETYRTWGVDTAYSILEEAKSFIKNHRIEHLISNTHQVTDGSTVWFQGNLSDCESYINQNKLQK